MVKRGLRAYVQTMDKADWDTKLENILMGYRFSPQSSAGFSPYFLMYGRQPLIPSSIQKDMQLPLDIDQPLEIWRMILHRATLLRRHTPMAMANMLIARHRPPS